MEQPPKSIALKIANANRRFLDQGSTNKAGVNAAQQRARMLDDLLDHGPCSDCVLLFAHEDSRVIGCTSPVQPRDVVDNMIMGYIPPKCSYQKPHSSEDSSIETY